MQADEESSDSSDAEGARSFFQKWSRPSAGFAADSYAAFSKYVECGKAWLRKQAVAFVRQHRDDFVSEVYGSDCTPLKFRKRYQMESGGLHVTREGGASGEWLAERMFLLVDDCSRTSIFAEPRLMEVKTAWAHFNAWQELRLDLRCAGHRGGLHRHFVYDRAVNLPVSRHQVQYSHVEYARDRAERGAEAAFEQWIKTFNTNTECYNHDAHNALAWGVQHSHQSDDQPQSLKFAYVAVEALKGSYSEFAPHLMQWLFLVVSYETMEDDGGLFALCNALGLASDLSDKIIHLRLRFDKGRVWVAKWCRDDAELFPSLCTVYLMLWAWKTFTASRWMTFGISARIAISSIVFGIEAYTTWLLEQGRVSKYYLRGAKYLTIEVKQLLAVVAFSSWVADSQLKQQAAAHPRRPRSGAYSRDAVCPGVP